MCLHICESCVAIFLHLLWKMWFFKFITDGHRPYITCFSHTKFEIQVFYKLGKITCKKIVLLISHQLTQLAHFETSDHQLCSVHCAPLQQLQLFISIHGFHPNRVEWVGCSNLSVCLSAAKLNIEWSQSVKTWNDLKWYINDILESRNCMVFGLKGQRSSSISAFFTLMSGAFD